MASSDTDIANRALRLLKAGNITSLTDGSSNANKLNDIFEEVRDDLLREHPWNFGTRMVKLAKGSTAPAFEFDFHYPFPDLWMRTISVHGNDAGASTILYREAEVGGKGGIMTSADEVWMRYVYRVTDPNRMPADFRAAFAYELALAVPGIPNLSAAAREALAREARRKLNRAKHNDAMGSTPERRPLGSWLNSRGGLLSDRARPD